MSDREKNYISAVALLQGNEQRGYRLHIYHNAYADHPIPADWLSGIGSLKQYMLNSHPAAGFGDWVEI